ncbi:MAG: sel1 repeat family protein [Gammaproteobacteria bacterium]|nr:sel1 repeat family protein [Gammaproteobacteria bacterium]
MPTDVTRRALLVLLVLAFGVSACAGRQAEPDAERYERLVAALSSGQSDAWVELPEAFLARDDFARRLARLEQLQSEARGESAAVELDRLGRGMLDAYYGDLRAHELLQRLAFATGDDARGEFHRQALNELTAVIEASGSGSASDPWKVLSATEAFVWLTHQRHEVAGALYHGADTNGTLALVLKARRRDEDNLRELWFDLTPTYRATLRVLGDDSPNPSELIAARARDGDAAAQTSYAIRLWHRGSAESTIQAVHWLQRASAEGNVIAREMLGVVYGVIARTRSGEEAEQLIDAAVDQFLLAVGQGSSTALYNLGQLYLSGHFGSENQPAGVDLLRQAVERDNLDAMVLLARLRYNGQFVSQNRTAALQLLKRAAAGGHPEGQLFYARHLLSTDDGEGFDEQALTWLRQAAESGESAEAMLLYGTLLARGEFAPQDTVRAVNWFKQAAERAVDADTINTVAWILVVAEQQDLRDPQHGLALMDALMTQDEAAAMNAAYLDTWAASYAANGDFQRAVEIQQQAVAVAEAEHARREDGGPEYLPLLREHLEKFRNGETVSEDVP